VIDVASVMVAGASVAAADAEGTGVGVTLKL
jgi:hypothetical protein